AEYYDSTTGQWTPISTNTGQYYYVNPNTGAAVLYNPNAKSTFLGYGGSNPNFNDPMFAGNALAPSYGADPLDTQVRDQKTGEVVNAVNGILMVGGVAIPLINLGGVATTSTVGGLGSISGNATGSFGEILTAGISSTYNPATKGSSILNISTNVTASEFQANLLANGYSIIGNGISKNGANVQLSNGISTYSIYTRTSTGSSGAQYWGPGGQEIKFSLGAR
ncbi:hypothetical protein WJT86_12240, partial [Microvirga sp. W0021]